MIAKIKAQSQKETQNIITVHTIVEFPGNIGEEYFNQVCGSLLKFKKSSSSHLNISRSIVPQMYMTISIYNFEEMFHQLSVSLLKRFDHFPMGTRWGARVYRPSLPSFPSHGK